MPGEGRVIVIIRSGGDIYKMYILLTAISRQADMEIPVPSICLRAKYFPLGLRGENKGNTSLREV